MVQSSPPGQDTLDEISAGAVVFMIICCKVEVCAPSQLLDVKIYKELERMQWRTTWHMLPAGLYVVAGPGDRRESLAVPIVRPEDSDSQNSGGTSATFTGPGLWYIGLVACQVMIKDHSSQIAPCALDQLQQ